MASGNERQASLRKALRGGGGLIGTVVSSSDPVFAEISASKFDLVWVDLEHSALSPRDVQTLVISAVAAGAFSLIRVPSAHVSLSALLDTGTDGIVLPRVDAAAVVEEVAAELQFPPAGRRGYAPRRSGLALGTAPVGTRPACIVQIESAAGLDAAAEIAAVDVCDALVVGTNDLALDLGVPMDVDEPALGDALQRVREAATSANKGWGVAAGGDAERVGGLVAPDALIVYGSDVRMFSDVVDERSRRVRAKR